MLDADRPGVWLSGRASLCEASDSTPRSVKQTNKNKTQKQNHKESQRQFRRLCGGLATAGQVWFDAFVCFGTLNIILLTPFNQRLRLDMRLRTGLCDSVLFLRGEVGPPS